MPKWLEIPLTVVLFTAAMTVVGVARARAEAPFHVGAARSASVMSAIVQFCGAYFLIDGPKAAKISAASREIALKTAPAGQGQSIVNAEFKRRLKEVEATGTPFWCQNQREVQKNLGTGIFLN